MSCTCPYCGKPAKLVDGLAIYPRRSDLAELRFWKCGPCDAYVGCHKRGARIGRNRISDGTVPLGRLANAELRTWKSRVHEVFDPIWNGGGMTRNAAYAWLAHKLGIHQSDCHVGMFDVEQCKRAVLICERHQESNGITRQMAKLQASWDARWGKGVHA